MEEVIENNYGETEEAELSLEEMIRKAEADAVRLRQSTATRDREQLKKINIRLAVVRVLGRFKESRTA